MVTFAEKAEKENSEHPAKYVTSEFENNGTRFYYETTPHHPTEKIDPSQRSLILKLESPFSQGTIDELLSFLDITELSRTQSSDLVLSTSEGENITVRQLYVPEFDLHHHKICLTMPRKMRATQRFDAFALMFSKMMEDFYGIKLGLTYGSILYDLDSKGKDNSEGVISHLRGNYSDVNLDYLNVDIFQSPVELNAKDIVRNLFKLQKDISYVILDLSNSFSGESLHAESKLDSSLNFNFQIGSIGPEKRIRYGNNMFDIYRKITGTGPEPTFSNHNAFIDIK